MYTTEEGMIGGPQYRRGYDLIPIVNLYIAELRVLFIGHGTIEVQSRSHLSGIRGRRSVLVWNFTSITNLYITEVTILFTGHGTVEFQFRSHLPGICGRRSVWIWNGEAVSRCRDIRAWVQAWTSKYVDARSHTFLKKWISDKKDKVQGKEKWIFGQV
jgi:hypothetical protein